jgi:hypothetical protein
VNLAGKPTFAQGFHFSVNSDALTSFLSQILIIGHGPTQTGIEILQQGIAQGMGGGNELDQQGGGSA